MTGSKRGGPLTLNSVLTNCESVRLFPSGRHYLNERDAKDCGECKDGKSGRCWSWTLSSKANKHAAQPTYARPGSNARTRAKKHTI